MPFGIGQEAVDRICGVLAKYPQVQAARLYGSRAKGTFKPGSDIDLTLIGNEIKQETLNQIDNEIDDLLLPWMIDLSIHAHIESPELLEHIDRVGKLFYQQEKPRS